MILYNRWLLLYVSPHGSLVSGAISQWVRAKLHVPLFVICCVLSKVPETAKASAERLLLGQARQKTLTLTMLREAPRIKELAVISHAEREQGRAGLELGSGGRGGYITGHLSVGNSSLGHRSGQGNR